MSKSTSETGHAKNLANFKTLNVYVGKLPKYNPSKPSLAMPAMLQKAEDGTAVMKAVNIAHTPYSKAVDEQEVAFMPLSALITRVGKSFKLSVENPQDADTLMAHSKRIRGISGKSKPPAAVDGRTDANVEESKSKSTQSYDFKVENLDRLVTHLESSPNYAPNEVELQTATLRAYHGSIKKLTEDVDGFFTNLKNARQERDIVFYDPKNGLVAMANDAKGYIASVFGYTSKEAKYVNSLIIKDIRPEDKK